MGKQTLFDPVMMRYYDQNAGRYYVEYMKKGEPNTAIGAIDHMLRGYEEEKVGLPRKRAKEILKKMAERRESDYVERTRL